MLNQVKPTLLNFKLMMLTRFLLIVAASLSSYLVAAQENSNKLWYQSPARVWEEALPLGNAKTGAMVFGNVSKERLQLNNNTLWSGYPNAGNNPKGVAALPMVRQAIITEDYGKATDIWKKNLQGPYSARYLTMADLYLDFNFKDSTATTYRRELDISKAIHKVTYKVGGVTYTRETFISHPDRVLLIRITADKPNTISFNTQLHSKLKYVTRANAANYLVLKGKAPKHVAHRST
jgi:alpha-L-fucosidase 2